MKPNNLIGSIIGLLVSLALFFWSLHYNFLGEKTSFDPLLRATLIFIISLLISEHISRFISNSDVYKSQQNLLSTLEQKIDFKPIGSTEEALKYIINNLYKVEYVENTHVKLGKKHEGIYNSIIYNQYIKTIKREINKGLIWNDVIGESSLYRNEQLINWANEKPRHRRLITKTIPDKIPIVNHITLKYRNSQKRETLFGWVFKMDNPDVQVFICSDPKLVDYFQSYFSKLADCSTN
jgi:hypothetical protein